MEEIDDTPPLNEAAEFNEWLWLGDGFAQLADEAERDGDPGALAVVAAVRPRIKTYPADVVSRALLQRATVVRQWQLFLNKYAVLLIPVSAELPFPDTNSICKATQRFNGCGMRSFCCERPLCWVRRH